MKNFINLRIQTANPHSIKHNFRTHTSMVSRNQVYNAKDSNKIIIELQNNKLSVVDISDFNIKAILRKQRAILKANTIEYKKLYKERTGRNPDSSFHTHAEGVLTFSESIDLDLGSKYTIEELSKIALATIKETCKKLGTKMVEDSLVIHQNEKRFHYHWTMLNYDSNGFSIIHKNKSAKILSSLQDIAFKHFGKLGMDRGIKRYGTFQPTIRHQTTSRYYEKQLSNSAYEYNQIKLELKKVYQQLEDQKQLNKEKVAEYKILRAKVTELKNDEAISLVDTKELHSKISQQQKEHRELNKEILEQQKTIKEYNNQIETKKNTLKIVTDLSEIDIEAKSFQKTLSQSILKQVKSYAKVSQGAKVLNKYFDLFSIDDKKLHNIKYTFSAIELKKFIQRIATHATKEAFTPHGNMHKELIDKVASLEQALENKNDYIEPSLHQEIENKLSEIETKNKTLEEERASLFRSHNNMMQNIEKEKDKLIKKDEAIEKSKTDNLKQEDKIKLLKNKVLLLQKQKKKLFDNTRREMLDIGLDKDLEDIKK